MHRIIFLFVFLLTTVRGQIEGESCVYAHFTNTIGHCTSLSACQTAREDYIQSGIRPTYCSNNASGDRLICCRDGSNIQNSASNRPPDQSVIGPIYCSYNASVNRLICYRDGSNIQNSASNRPPDDRPLGGNAEQLNDRRRISERKCEEYSSNAEMEFGYIPGGEDTKTVEFSHMAAIGWANYGKYGFRCVGSLISSLYVVTAAHCGRDSSAEIPEPAIVRLGDQNVDNSVVGPNRMDIAIRRMIKHPNYQSPKVYNDIALLELGAEVSFNSAIRPVCLWTKPDLTGYRTVIETGWGRTNDRDGDFSNELQKASLELLDVGFCNETLKPLMNRNFRNGFIDSQLCAGGQGICRSGAPIQVLSQGNSSIIYIVGLTSFGKSCDATPSVYTRIWSYLDWIESIAWPGH